MHFIAVQKSYGEIQVGFWPLYIPSKATVGGESREPTGAQNAYAGATRKARNEHWQRGCAREKDRERERAREIERGWRESEIGRTCVRSDNIETYISGRQSR